MKKTANKTKLIFTILLVTVAFFTMAEPKDVISLEELAEFDMAIYIEKTHLPLDGLVLPDGTPYDSGTLQGKYALVNLWVTWCPYCRQEKASIDRIYREQGNEELAILTVSLGEEPETVRQYMEENHYVFPVVVDRENKLKEEYSPRLPTSYILDPKGNILARINGNKEWDSEQMLRVIRLLTTSGNGR